MSKKLNRPSFKDFKAESLRDPKVKIEYDALEAEFELMSQMIAARKLRKLSQADVARLLQTKQPAIARLEAGGCFKTSIEKLYQYANVLGYHLQVRLVRIR
jgi:predicted XRE-type DNA-binding protein